MSIHSMSESSVGQLSDAGVRQPAGAEIADEFEGVLHLPKRTPALHRQSLVRAVEGEIVPRLLLAWRSAAPKPQPVPSVAIQAEEAEHLARLLLADNFELPRAFVDAIRDRGVPEREICLQLLAPAARCLGSLWDRDECSFLQVAIGLGCLHQLLQRAGTQTPGPLRSRSRGRGRRALLATVPGERHCFGVLMVSRFFRLNGWDVANEFFNDERELAARVRAESFAVVGLSAGSETRLEALITAVRIVRRSSRNAAVGIIVGGPLFQNHPELAARVGADAMAEDGEQAVRLAESVCDLLAGE